jgi:hypothetical protein
MLELKYVENKNRNKDFYWKLYFDKIQVVQRFLHVYETNARRERYKLMFLFIYSSIY